MNMAKPMDKERWSALIKTITECSNSDLYRIEEFVNKEIRLSETAIKEGFEVRK